jgi:CheY-like chemotaxis protein
LNISLVDDDRNLVTTLSYGLRKAMGEAASIVICFSGSEALSMLATQAFDVVISDYNMPGQSGLEFLKRIKQDHREMILVLATAYATDVLEEGVSQLGMGYIHYQALRTILPWANDQGLDPTQRNNQGR